MLPEPPNRERLCPARAARQELHGVALGDCPLNEHQPVHDWLKRIVRVRVNHKTQGGVQNLREVHIPIFNGVHIPIDACIFSVASDEMLHQPALKIGYHSVNIHDNHLFVHIYPSRFCNFNLALARQLEIVFSVIPIRFAHSRI